MPNIGVPELLIVLLIGVMVFGVGKLPEVGAALGKSIRQFRDSSSGGEKPAGEDKPKTD
jgi:sec-independent protein translocase protein TatA